MPAIPTPAGLRDRIESIHLVRGDAGGQLVLPSSGVVLGFQLSGAVAHGDRQLDPLGVTGLLRRGRRFQYRNGTTSVLVRFRPGAGAALGVPARELFDQSIALDALLARPLRPVAARILEALDDPRGGTSVAAVARSLQVSERQLSRRFLARVGIAPKRYAGLRRFERATLALRSQGSLAAAALDAGYYDQPHLAREIRSFAGMTPRELWRFLR